MTHRKHLEQLAKHTKVRPPELEISARPPSALGYLWAWFRELSWNSPLSYVELKAWSEMTHRPLTAFETDVLMKLDKLLRSANV